MHRVVRHSLAASAMILVILPLGLAQASRLPAHGAMSLRYHFATGERFSYRMRLTMQVSTAGTGVSTSAGNAAVTLAGIVGYHIVRVDGSGGAYAETSARDMKMTVTTSGRTTTSAVAAPAPAQIYLGADGSQRGAASGGFSAYGSPALGSLPSGPVVPGARWSSTAYASLPSTLGAAFAPMRLTAQNLFARYGVVQGERTAVIDSSGALQYVTDTTVDGLPVHMHLSGSLSGESSFGTVARRELSATMHMDMRLFMTARAANAPGQAIREHMVMSLTMDPAAG